MQVISLRQALLKMLSAVNMSKKEFINLKEHVLKNLKENENKELNNAADAQVQVLDGFISGIERIESFGLNLMFKITEKFATFSDEKNKEAPS